MCGSYVWIICVHHNVCVCAKYVYVLSMCTFNLRNFITWTDVAFMEPSARNLMDMAGLCRLMYLITKQ